MCEGTENFETPSTNHKHLDDDQTADKTYILYRASLKTPVNNVITIMNNQEIKNKKRTFPYSLFN